MSIAIASHPALRCCHRSCCRRWCRTVALCRRCARRAARATKVVQSKCRGLEGLWLSDYSTAVLDVESAIEAVNFIIDNTYGKIYKQDQGIPMGTSPAVFIANLTYSPMSWTL